MYFYASYGSEKVKRMTKMIRLKMTKFEWKRQNDDGGSGEENK